MNIFAGWMNPAAAPGARSKALAQFKVTDAPLNLRHMVVTYDNGAPDKIEVRQSIPQGGESRVIDLRGVSKRRFN